MQLSLSPEKSPTPCRVGQTWRAHLNQNGQCRLNAASKPCALNHFHLTTATMALLINPKNVMMWWLWAIVVWPPTSNSTSHQQLAWSWISLMATHTPPPPTSNNIPFKSWDPQCSKYPQNNKRQGLAFAPMVAETLGNFGPDLLQFLWNLANHLAQLICGVNSKQQSTPQTGDNSKLFTPSHVSLRRSHHLRLGPHL